MKEKRKEYQIRKTNKGEYNGKANVVKKKWRRKRGNRYYVDCVP
jgi:hypothetical protein